MHIDLLQTTGKGRGKDTHATENGKKTACGINLTKPENIGAFASTGELSDVSQISEITCEKCKTVIAKKLIRESNREMAQMLKEERKRERAAAKHHTGEMSSPVTSSSDRDDYVPPSMRRQQQQAQKPIVAPPPAPMKPVSMPAPQPASDDFAIPQVPTSIPGVFPSGVSRPAAPQVPVQPAAPVDDVLAQFAIPTVPTSLPNQAPAAPQAPVQPAAPVDDVLAQFAIPTVPTSLPGVVPSVDPAEDLLAQLTPPTAPQPAALEEIANSIFDPTQNPVAAPSETISPLSESFTANVPTAEEIVEVTPTPAADGMAAFIPPVSPVSEPDDFFVMPGTQSQSINSIPELTIPTVPSTPAEAKLTVPSGISAAEENSIPTLEIPPLPQQQPYPTEMRGYGLPQGQPMPGYPQPDAAASVPADRSAEEEKLLKAKRAKAAAAPGTPTPLFVGYSADGRQLFQTYDAAGNPIPITEPVYSAPPEQKQPQITPASIARDGAPVLEIEDLMSEMGIDDPRKKKADTGAVVHFTEYKMPDPAKKKRNTTPKSAQPSPASSGPISAAEAKRRKKLEKINSQFERDLRARGIDPSTGAFIGKGKK